jgi:acylphosphatase
MNKKITVHISGRVQGVGYRYFVLQRARNLGLTGYVRNLRDGGVEVAAEGEEQTLKSFLKDLQQGPAGAAVGKIETAWQESAGNIATFEIKF